VITGKYNTVPVSLSRGCLIPMYEYMAVLEIPSSSDNMNGIELAHNRVHW
jgi:hypothetical protein